MDIRVNINTGWRSSAYAPVTMVEAQRLGGFRTTLGVLFMRDKTPIGVMTLLRNIVQPFADAEADLAATPTKP